MTGRLSVRGLLRERLLGWVQLTLRTLLGLLSPVFPTSRSVVVSGVPDTEGNAVEVAAALLRRFDGTVVWLADSSSRGSGLRDLETRGVRVVPKMSAHGLWHYLRAEVVFFTHGLYGSPRPCRRKALVNLWHGDGPKDIRPDGGLSALIPSTFLVGNTDLWSQDQADAFGVPPDRVLVTGNPRTDQLGRPPTPERLAPLGITGDFVVWMPTFRQTRATGAVRVRSDAGEAGAPATGEALAALVMSLAGRGMQLVVKAHHMDAEAHDTPGAVMVTDASLDQASVTLYELLGASSGLVTDYSSVWVDYLLVDRPIGFWIADRATYRRPLVPPDVLGWLPGESADLADQPFEAFLADLEQGGAATASARREVAGRIGLNDTRTAADDLLDELRTRGVLSVHDRDQTA